jgi:outer membrane murein-binding lipoprotein Lpp
MGRICATFVVVGAVVAAGCGGAADANSPASAATTLAAAPKPCTSAGRSLVVGFVEAFN